VLWIVCEYLGLEIYSPIRLVGDVGGSELVKWQCQS